MRLLFVVFFSSFSTGSSIGTFSLHTAGSSATVWRCQGKVNVLLTVQTNNKAGNIDNLLSNAAVSGCLPDVALFDEDACVVD